MKKTGKKINLGELLKHSDNNRLYAFIEAYATSNPAFKANLLSHIDPQKKRETIKNYTAQVNAIFGGTELSSGNRYDAFGSYGFDATAVAAGLDALLEKARYYVKQQQVTEALHICKALIETIPGNWDPNCDDEGAVQVPYDDAIELLEILLKQKKVTAAQKQSLFEWYSIECKNLKHDEIGLNTHITTLERFFTDTPEMLRRNLANMEQRIKDAPDEYHKEAAVIDRINLLQQQGMKEEAETAITTWLKFSKVRELRYQTMRQQKQYAAVIPLIETGIKIAAGKGLHGTVADWKDKLLDIYHLQKEKENCLALAEDLLHYGRENRKYYLYLKKHTPPPVWPQTLERILAEMNKKGYRGASDLHEAMLVEHGMWQKLYAFCKKQDITYLVKHEKHLKPHYATEIFNQYHAYVEKTVLITDVHAYKEVAAMLKKMKGFKGGAEVVNSLLKKYRELYKRRPKMMVALNKV